MRTRIGINTGFAVIGNIGSAMRFNYTMMGDSVNLAARCESGAKSYGVYIMTTASTLEEALRDGESLNYRKLDRIVVKGRSQSVEIYELWDGTVDLEMATACKSAYEAALERYFAGDWQALWMDLVSPRVSSHQRRWPHDSVCGALRRAVASFSRRVGPTTGTVCIGCGRSRRGTGRGFRRSNGFTAMPLILSESCIDVL